MKKCSTLIFVVKKFTGRYPGANRDKAWNFLAETDETLFSPSDGSIKRIMDFASSYEVMDSKSAGKIEIIVN